MPTSLRLVPAIVVLLTGAATAAEPCAVVPELGLTAVAEDRLARLEEARSRGIAEALEDGAAEADEVVEALFEQGLTPVAEMPAGPYQCRTIKFGGPFGSFVAYSWFRCRIEAAESGYTIEKLTGSQRFTGDLIEVGGGLVFRGADHYADESPLAYGDDPERNAVGCVSRVAPGAGSYLLEQPLPFLESTHDVIELKPTG